MGRQKPGHLEKVEQMKTTPVKIVHFQATNQAVARKEIEFCRENYLGCPVRLTETLPL